MRAHEDNSCWEPADVPPACRAWRSARVLPTDLPPLVDVDYEPVDADERGIWQSMEQIEETIQASPQRLNDPELQGYTAGIIEQLMGRETPDLRDLSDAQRAFQCVDVPDGNDDREHRADGARAQ